MKNFLKMTLAVLCAMILLTVISIFLFSGFVSALSASSGSARTPISRNSVLKVDMSEFVLSEQSAEFDPMLALKGENVATIGIWEAVSAINAAANDPNISYIYLKPEGGFASYEFRQALSHFRDSGKPILAYMDNASTGSYYMATVADKIYMTAHEGGMSMMFGVSGQLIFLKDILDKLGINIQLIRHGKYKSAGEMFIRNSSSPENMEQNQAMIDALWAEYCGTMAESRGISSEKLNSMIDRLELDTPQDFFDAGLVDGLLTKDELKSKLTSLAVEESFSKVNMVPFQDYVASKTAVPSKSKKKVAIIYADGEIVDAADNKNIQGDEMAETIAKVRADSTVKAVVFRVNSPGGAVLSSEKIKNEIDLLKAEKPLVTSFGAYAASGGYWISAATGHIFANPTTLTGSIGVFSIIPDFSGTLKKIAHVNITPVNSNKHSDILSGVRALDSEEIAYMQGSVESIYDRFVSIVAEGRNMAPDYVDKIGQGRVWAGSEAVKIGLVDELGSLEDAVKWVIAEAGEGGDDSDISSWSVVGYPKPQTTMEMLMEMIEGKPEQNVFSGTALEQTAKVAKSWADKAIKSSKPEFIARMPYDIIWQNR